MHAADPRHRQRDETRSRGNITSAMPKAKRLRSGSKSEPQKAAGGRPTTADLEGETDFAQLAKLHWLKTTKRATKVKVKNDVIKTEIWDSLEKESFAFKSLLVLEGLQLLERYGDPLMLRSAS